MRGVWMRVLAAVLSAGLLAFSFPLSLPALPFAALDTLALPGMQGSEGYAQLAWLAFIALIPLLEAVRLSPRPREAFVWGYLCGFVWMLISWDWLSSFGWLPVILMAAFYALPLGLFALLCHHVLSRGQPAWLIWLVPAAWTALEYLRSFGFWAFPWNLLGYSQARHLSLIQIADVGGVFAVSFLIVLANCALYAVLTPLKPPRQRWGHALLAAAVLCAALAYGDWRLLQHPPAATPAQQASPLRVALIQGGMDTFERWSETRFQDSLAQYLPPTQRAVREWATAQAQQRLGRSGAVGPFQPQSLLVIWPESTLPRSMDPRRAARVPPQLRTALAGPSGVALLLGAIGKPRDDQHQENGCLLVEGNGQLRWPYSKVRVVPYGEVVPLREVARFLQYPWGDDDVSEGRSLEPLNWRGFSLGLMVCFDNVFGFVSRAQVRDGAQALVLVTNNSWYKLHSGIRQHCDIDVLRAVELRRPLARCSTTGYSQIVDDCGRVLETTAIDGAAQLVRDLPLSQACSPYTAAGDLFAQLCTLAALLGCGWLLLNGRSEGLL